MLQSVIGAEHGASSFLCDSQTLNMRLVFLLAVAVAVAVALPRGAVEAGDAGSGLAGASSTDDPESSRASRPFMIGKDDEGAAMVRLRSRRLGGRDFTCEFRHVTKEQEAAGAGAGAFGADAAADGFQAVHRDVETVLGKLSGICVRKTLDYWKYELCFDSRISQSHGRDSFLLGTFSGMDGAHQLYDEGTRCEALPGNVGRETRVEFVCDALLRLLSVEEVSTCSYKAFVSTPVVCGHPAFVQSTRHIPVGGADDDAGAPKTEWFLEVAETLGGQIVCSASALDPAAELQFEEMELSLSSALPAAQGGGGGGGGGGDGGGDGARLRFERHVVRAKGRLALSKDAGHYEMRKADGGSKLSLRDGADFVGDVAFAMIQAVPVA